MFTSWTQNLLVPGCVILLTALTLTEMTSAAKLPQSQNSGEGKRGDTVLVTSPVNCQPVPHDTLWLRLDVEPITDQDQDEADSDWPGNSDDVTSTTTTTTLSPHHRRRHRGGGAKAARGGAKRVRRQEPEQDDRSGVEGAPGKPPSASRRPQSAETSGDLQRSVPRRCAGCPASSRSPAHRD